MELLKASFLLLTFILTVPCPSYAEQKHAPININCNAPYGCNWITEYTNNYSSWNKKNIDDLMNQLKGTQSFSAAKVKLSNGVLNIELTPVIVVQSIIINFSEIKVPEIENKIRIKKGSHLSKKSIEDSIKSIKNYLFQLGYENHKIKIDTAPTERNLANLIISLEIDPPIKWAEVYLNFKSSVLSEKEGKRRIRRILESKKGKFADQFKVENDLVNLKSWLVKNGYFLGEVTSKQEKTENGRIISYTIKTGKKFSFGFYGDVLFNRGHYLDIIRSAIDQGEEDFLKKSQNDLVEEYKSLGFHNVSVKLRKRYNKKSKTQHTRFIIKKNSKIYLDGINFTGNQELKSDYLLKIFKELAPTVVKNGFFYEKGITEASDKLPTIYKSNGFLLAKVGKVSFKFSKNKKHAEAFISITEGPRTYVDEIHIKGLDPEEETETRKIFAQERGDPFNIILFESKLQEIRTYFKEKGFLDVKIENDGEQDFVIYSRNFHHVVINMNINKGRINRIGEILVIGNKRTKLKVITRELYFLNKGEPLTLTKLRKTEQKIIQLGLFKIVKVKLLPMKENNERDLQITVSEHKPGSVITGVGYRTDLGPRAFVEWSKNNIGGWDTSVSVKGEINKRFRYPAEKDHENFHNEHTFMEYKLDSEIRRPWMLGRFTEARSGISIRQKHFNSFDARILKIELGALKNFNELLRGNLNWNLERITQEHAPEDLKDTDNGKFVIGSLSPSLTLDTTNSKGHPTKGVFSKLEFEWASPIFGSQKGDETNINEPKINFHTITTRNHYYYSPTDWMTLAFAARAGYQRNNIRDPLLDSTTGDQKVDSKGAPLLSGFIPSIKLFRLGGRDSIRGFKEDAINIDSYRVQGAASFLNFKFEPRFPLSDTLVFGVFTDAGQVYLIDTNDNLFNLSDMFWTYGVSLRYVTPVGPLSFDFGIQTQDNKHRSAFHLSIHTF